MQIYDKMEFEEGTVEDESRDGDQSDVSNSDDDS